MDGDGDADIVFQSTDTSIPDLNKLHWFENMDGLGNFNQIHTITSEEVYHHPMKCGDIDADGDTDILVLSNTGLIKLYASPQYSNHRLS